MRKGILSMEELDQPEIVEEAVVATPEAVAELETDVAVADVERAETRADEEEDRVEEAESIRDTVDAVADSVDESVAPEVTEGGEPVVDEKGEAVVGEGLDEEEAERVEVSLEHFRRRLGLKKKLVPAMEGFKDVATRREKTIELSKNLRALSGAIDRQITASQEGWWANFKHRSEVLTTGFDKVEKQTGVISRSVLDRGFKEEGEIKQPGWAISIPTTGSEATAADVIKALEEDLKVVKGPAINKAIAFSISALKDVAHELKENGGIGTKISEASVARLEKIGAEAAKLASEISSVEINKNSSKVAFKVANEADAKKIIKLVEELSKLHAGRGEQWDNAWNGWYDWYQANDGRLFGEDKKLGKQIEKSISSVFEKVATINWRVIATQVAALKYLKESAK